MWFLVRYKTHNYLLKILTKEQNNALESSLIIIKILIKKINWEKTQRHEEEELSFIIDYEDMKNIQKQKF